MKRYFAFALSVVIFGAGCSQGQGPLPPTVPASSTSTGDTFGMKQYIDPTYGFSFWFPSAIQVTSSTMRDSATFPGGVAVKTILVGEAGGTSVIVVDSPSSSITDEPDNHASPISQTKYFYDVRSGRWMVAFPEGRDDGSSAATTTADISKKTIGGLPMLPSGRRFDTTIIPLSTTRFLVVSDGGGSAFTSQLAKTVVLTGESVDPAAQMDALKAEAAAYANQ